VAKSYSLPHFKPSPSLFKWNIVQKRPNHPSEKLDISVVIGGFMAHCLTWRVTPMLHGGSLTLGMDMVNIHRHISSIYGHYLSIFGEYCVEVVPFMRVLNM
jgi:hypothetical protein